MSLYGLDIIVRRDGKYFINEINGIRIGMNGFLQIYGDNRVQRKVYNMLEEKYGELSINDGLYKINKYSKDHPILSKVAKLILKLPVLKNRFSQVPKILLSSKADIDWFSDEILNTRYVEFPFKMYDGQDSVVINIENDSKLPHPLVNSYIEEDIALNKFLQYQLLKKTDLNEYLPFTALVGLGATSDEDVNTLLGQNNEFVIKPILGSCGQGVKTINRNDLECYLGTGGSVSDNRFHDLVEMFLGQTIHGRYLEDFIKDNNYDFELGLSIIQPFIDSRKKMSKDNGEYSTVRAIICNGEFVDAYMRVSSNPRVNLSQDASAIQFEVGNDFNKFCESVISIYEDECSKLYNETFKKNLYLSYFENIDRKMLENSLLFNDFITNKLSL